MAAALDSTGERISTTEQVLVEQARRERFRDRIARYLAGPTTPSNYEAMCDLMQRDPNAPPDCEVCGGEGKRKIARHIIDELDDRLENQLVELEHLERLHASHVADARRPRAAGDELEERLRQEAVKDADLVAGKLVSLRESMRKDKEARDLKQYCKPCRGTGKGPRTHDLDPGRPDSMFSTVMCPACRGYDARQHPLLQHRHHGTSSGERRIHGPRRVEILENGTPEGALVVLESDPRDDDAAEFEDRCGECGGDAYLVPINARPALKTSGRIEEPDGIPDLPDTPESHYAQPEPDDTTTPEGFLGATRKDDPELAAAIAAYLGAHGDEWSDHAWGRRFALWPLGKPGRSLAGNAVSYDDTLAACARMRLAETYTRGTADLIKAASRFAFQLELRVERALHAAQRTYERAVGVA